MIDLNKLVKDFKAHIDSLTDEEMAEMQRKAEHDSQDCRDWYIEERLEIPFGEYKIVAEIDDRNLPEIPPEMVVYIADKNNCVVQDVCVVRQHYHIAHKTMDFVVYNDVIDCLVWADSDDEDYTHKHVIGIYEEEEK